MTDEDFVGIGKVSIEAVTDKAILITQGSFEGWIPRSQIENNINFEKGDIVDLYLSKWIAEKKGLV